MPTGMLVLSATLVVTQIRKGFTKEYKRMKPSIVTHFLRYFPARLRSESEAEREKSEEIACLILP